MSTKNLQWVLAARPEGAVRRTDFRLVETPLRALADGEFRIQVLYLGVAAVMRGYMLNTEKFERPLALGDVMHGRGVGRIVESRNPNWRVGEIVHGKMGWQQYAIADGSPYFLMFKVHQRVAPVSTALGVLGLTGFTSYLGLVDIGAVRAGDRVLVSGAAGGVGVERPTLETQRGDRGRREAAAVVRVDGAPVPLGGDVEGDRPGDLGAEDAGQRTGAERFVIVVHVGGVGVLAGGREVEEVSDIVQQRGDDQRVGCAVPSGQRCALGRVGGLGDVLAVAFGSELGEEGHDLIDRGEGVHVGVPSKSPMSDTRTRSATSPSAANAASFSR